MRDLDYYTIVLGTDNCGRFDFKLVDKHLDV